MLTVKAAEAKAPDVSFAWAVNVPPPAALGVPNTVPELVRESPAGREPARTDHV